MRRLPVVFALMVAIVSLPPTASAGAGPLDTSPQEMLWLYELNLMRWNPGAYGIAGDPSPPLAVNDDLMAAADQKAAYMAGSQYCGHSQPAWSNQMARNHGFPLPAWWTSNANYIEATWCSSGSAPIPSPLVFVTGNQYHHDLVMGRGGYGNHREAGVGYDLGGFAGLTFFAAPRDGYDRTPAESPVFITGVVFDDTNDNGRMDLGEGIGGATVTANPGNHLASTNAGGGYSILLPHGQSGSYTVSSPGAGNAAVSVADENVGVDFVLGRSEPVVRARNDSARWWGSDRYETAVAVSQQTYPDGAAVAYLAVGTNFPDAIAAGPEAGIESAPILLTARSSLPPVTRAELQRLQPDEVVVVGGVAAISNTVVSQVQAALPGVAIDRRWGATRYETAVDLSRRVFSSSVDAVYVVTGEGFADAVVTAPIALADRGPLLLVGPNAIPQAVRAELVRLDPNRIVVVGGTSSVSNGVLAGLHAYAPSVTRVSASDRYALSARLSRDNFAAPGTIVYVAVGDKYPDALAGGPATGVVTGPILLVTGADVPTSVGAELLRLAPESLVVLGGPAAVPTAVVDELDRYISG